MADASEFNKADFILLLKKEVIPGWWDKETHKLSCYIVSKLLEYAYEVNVKQEVSVRRALIRTWPELGVTRENKNLKYKENRD